MGIANADVVVVAYAVAVSVLVADGNKPGTGEVVFHQSHNPVATTFVVDIVVEFAVTAHPFSFEAEDVFLVHFPCEVGNDDVVVVQVAGMSFRYRVEYLVAVGAGEFEVFVQLLCNFEGGVGLIEFTGFEPIGLVSNARAGDLGGVDGGDNGGVEVDVGAVFTA